MSERGTYRYDDQTDRVVLVPPPPKPTTPAMPQTPDKPALYTGFYL